MGRRRRIKIDEVAEVYREAVVEGLPIATTLMEVLDMSAAQAKYYMRVMRRRGMTPPDGPDVHRYATATIYRNTTREKSWQVCQVCLTPQCQLETRAGPTIMTPLEGARDDRAAG